MKIFKSLQEIFGYFRRSSRVSEILKIHENSWWFDKERAFLTSDGIWDFKLTKLASKKKYLGPRKSCFRLRRHFRLPSGQACVQEKKYFGQRKSWFELKNVWDVYTSKLAYKKKARDQLNWPQVAFKTSNDTACD